MQFPSRRGRCIPHPDLAAGFTAALVCVAACSKAPPPDRHYFDTQIQPILNTFCVGNTSPCHKVEPSTGVALGNLDLTSFDAVQRRRDVLRTYGSYPQPLLLLKALPERSVQIPYAGKTYDSEIRHAGGKTLEPGTDAAFELKRWLENGATRDGLRPPVARNEGQGSCASVVPADAAARNLDRGSDAYLRFQQDVAPVLRASCSFSTCHGSPQSDFYLTCGDTDEQRDHNFLRASGFVADAPTAVEQSEILLRPLDPRAGGVSHTGGVFFSNDQDQTWKRIRQWAQAVQQNPPEPPARSMGEAFFSEHVMPVVLRRGCALEGCHSPSGFNDFRLRPGARGFLSRSAIRRNYEAALREFMSLDTPDVRQSRLVKKNLFPAHGGIAHRGGPLLEGAEGGTLSCPPTFDPAAAGAFCIVKEWHRLERLDHAADASLLAPGNIVPLVFVSRPPDPDGPLEFDTFRGGADLKLGDATIGSDGHVQALTNVRSALAGCEGLAGRADLDVRGPDWSYDGARVAFAVREGAEGGLDLWVLDVAGGRCTRLTSDRGRREAAVRVHNFDPAFAPDGSLVFASTRAGTLTLKRLLANSDLYRVGPDLNFGNVEQMTFLTNSELAPAFMQNGQLSFTAEKASPEFYQLAGRRLNWDLTDYHPLLGQRAKSDDTFGGERASLGYEQATEIREGLDRNFLVILSDRDARGSGGALATFNRSVGPFEQDRDDVTFLKSLVIVDGAATARPGTRGVYRSPSSLPDGEILASYSADVINPATDTPRYDLVAVDPLTGARRVLHAGGAASLVEAVLGFKRTERTLFRNLPQLVFGGHAGGGGDHAVVHFPDLPMLATLLNANLRRGRNVAAFTGAATLKVYESIGPRDGAAGGRQGAEQVVVNRKPLGSVPLQPDGSVRVELPSRTPLILELLDGGGKALFTMSEEHQVGPGEVITPGVPRKLFNGVCAGCHGSVSGMEGEIAVTPDALTGASVSLSRDRTPLKLQ